MVHNSQTKDDNQILFRSIIEMRKEHLELMEQSFSKEHDPSKFVDCILNFIESARKTGVLLGDEEDRSNAQTLLNYWSNELISLDVPPNTWPNSILADYDPNKAPELDDENCPYLGLKAFEEADRDLFVGRTQLIEELLEQPNKIKIILTMRQNFQTNFKNLSSSFDELFEKYYVEVTPFTSSELKEAIEIPAKRKGLQFEGDVVNKLVRDLEAKQMPLPLLQFVLMKLWERREKNLISEKIYCQVTGTLESPDQKGVRWALFHTADDFYKNYLSHEEQQTLERIFLQLLQPSLNSNVNSRRLQRKELYHKSEDKNQTNRVIDKLSQFNLIRLTKPKISNDGQISDDDQIEVVHPSLADSWDLLKSWLKTEKSEREDGLVLFKKAKDWEKQGGNSDFLLRGKQIDFAHKLINYEGKSDVKYAEEYKSPTSLQEKFVKKSIERRRTSRLKWTLGSLTILGLIIGLPTWVFFADLQEQHNLVIQQLESRLENTKAELQNANEQRKKAEEDLEKYKQSLQEIEDIRRKAGKLLDAAETNQINVKEQQDIARQILKDAEAALRDAEQKSGNFWLGVVTGVIGNFVILLLYELYRRWQEY